MWVEPYQVSIELENKKCKVMEVMREVGIDSFKCIDIRGVTGGQVIHLVEILTEDIVKIPREILIKTYRWRKGKTVVLIESIGCDVCNTILAHGSLLVSAKHIQNQTFIYSFIAPSFNYYRKIITAIESIGMKPKISKIVKFNMKGKTLTKNQEKALWLALKMGFFDYPRKIRISQLSKKMGVSPSTLSETIRRGIRKLLEEYFKL
ncbi:MAG: helix-turn-helix domain-containing protein [Candidatus Methanomethylicia archaeon]